MFIKGVGMTRFGIQNDATSHMVHEAAIEALDDAEMSMEEVDIIVMSNMDILSNGERQRHSASMASSLFKKQMPIITVPAGCAGGGTALWTAMQFYKTTSYRNILVIGFEKIVSNSNKKVTDDISMGG